MATTAGVPKPNEPAPDPAEQLRRMTHLMGRAQQLVLEQWAKDAAQPSPFTAALGATLAEDWAGALRDWAAHPDKLADLQQRYWTEAARLWETFLAGDPQSEVEAVADKDRRFKSEAWAGHPFFDLVRQSYLLTARTVMASIERFQGLDEAARARLAFHTRQFLDAMSPANFLAFNPDALKAALDSNGETLLKGFEHMLNDLQQGRMTMVDERAFEIGRNIAATPGKVIFENRLIQLIQYAPTTATVFETPVVIFPPWINKFYILDLTPEKSFIRFALDAGLTVFMVSWRNPGANLREATFDTYLKEGYLAALDAALRATGQPSAHTIGYCVAGTTLAAVLAWLDARGEAERVASATFLTAQVDFKDAGELKVFIEDGQLEALEKIAETTGYLDGRLMASTFSALRANDLIWNYVTNNYLLGRDYMPFDLLYWNSDATNVPAKWHICYLRDLYRDNKLARREMTMDGVAIDLDRVRTPTYVQAGREDHIAPAKSVYHITEHFRGELRFVLAGSGHVAGVVNPPASGKYQHWVVDGPPPPTLDQFIAQAREVKGSWWPDWTAWIAARGGATLPARDPGPGIEDAPGRYVREKVG